MIACPPVTTRVFTDNPSRLTCGALYPNHLTADIIIPIFIIYHFSKKRIPPVGSHESNTYIVSVNISDLSFFPF